MRRLNHSAPLERCTPITSTRARRSGPWLTLIAIPFLCIACDDITWPLESSDTLSIEKAPTSNGDLQSDSVFATIQPLRVLVKADGAVASGVPVYWSISPDSVAEASTTLTDVNGIASLQLTLGVKPMVYSVKATLRKGAGGPAVTFTATATAGRIADLRITSGADQTDTATALLSTPYTVRATDAYGNLVVGAPIDWVVTAGGGSISPSQSITSALGEATARHTLGPATGVNEVTASALGTSRVVTFKATATAARPTRLKMMSGDNQSALTNQSLAADYVVRVTDSYDNGIPGIEIQWTITSGGGALSSTRSTTGPDGSAAIRLTLGPSAGPQSVSAAAAELPTTPRVVFTSTAVAPPQFATLRVNISTTGADFDNAIGVMVQRCSGTPTVCAFQFQHESRTASANSTTEFILDFTGYYRITLFDVALNCTVAENSRLVTSNLGGVTEAAFRISCIAAGAIRVSAATTGIDGPSSYSFTVNNNFAGTVGSSAPATFIVGAGSHSITLLSVPLNCTLTGANPVLATVTAGATTDVQFNVSCATNPTLSVTVTTTGSNIPSSYEVEVDGYYDYYAYLFSVPANGTGSIRVTPGYHWLVLKAPSNCTVNAGTGRSVTLMLGGSSNVPFVVECR